MAKVDATRNYGAETVLAGAMFDDALAEAMTRAEEAGATFVHAFEDEAVIAGQGTLGLELAEQLPDARDVRRCRSAVAGSRRGSRSRCGRSGRASGSSVCRPAGRGRGRSPTASRSSIRAS